MKKVASIFLIIVGVFASIPLILFISILVSRLKFYYYLETEPHAFPNTTWSSENGEVVLYIDEDGHGKVTFQNDSHTEVFYFISEYSPHAEVYYWDVVEKGYTSEEDLCERWRYSKTSKDSFAVVVEKTTFLNVEDQLTFRKTGDGSE